MITPSGGPHGGLPSPDSAPNGGGHRPHPAEHGDPTDAGFESLRRIRWRQRTTTPPPGSPVCEWVAVATVVTCIPLLYWAVPEAAYVPAVLLAAAGTVALAGRCGVSAELMGMRRERVRAGLAAGVKAGAVVAFAVVVLALVPWTRSFLADDRFVGVPGTEALYEVLVRIPLGTALGEELIFRGALLGLFLRRLSVGGAVVASSALFGLWHILSALDSVETNPAGDGLASPLGIAGAIVGTVAVTALAGAILSWLRLKTGSIVAPVILHTAINSSAYVAGWLVISRGWAS